MKTLCLTLIAAVVGLSAGCARRQPPQPVDADFEAKLDLSALRLMAVQHQQTVKTFDSYARQTVEQITGRQSYAGQDAVFTVLDIANNPEAYRTVNLIKIDNVPLRTEFRRLAFVPVEEQERIVEQGTISLDLAHRPEVRTLLEMARAADVRKAEAVNQFAGALQTLEQLSGNLGGQDFFPPVAVVPPGKPGDGDWHRVIDVAANDPDVVALLAKGNQPAPAPVPGYTAAAIHPVVHAALALFDGWRQQDPQQVSSAALTLAEASAAVDPAAYPSEFQRHVEVVYNRLAKMTLPGAACYFVAFVCFVTAARSGLASVRLWGLRLLVLGLAIHTAGIGVRWWLVGSIPIKNEFESVMFSAWFGIVIGSLLELGLIQWAARVVLAAAVGTQRVAGTPVRNLFGAASSFVGCLALVALFTVPYAFGVNIGQEVGQSQGVLMSYWLYIHVTMVTASYALIGMGFALSVWWLIRYYADYGTLRRINQHRLEGEARGFDVVLPGGSPAAAAAAVSVPMTLAQMVFFPVAKSAAVVAARRPAATAEAHTASTVNFLATLDACNLVVLQLAFWVLGVGIALGAMWADQSWGRFWAWDPKETFALITWIVYLVAVHVRIATEHKAWWTAVLATGGFFVMLFNWIGVNYFLHGLHSYAG